MAREIPTEAEVLGWYASLSNWGRWGADDELGTLNLITSKKRAQAARLVREGVTIPAPRPASGARTRSNTRTSQPRRSSRCAAISPAMEPPITRARRKRGTVAVQHRVAASEATPARARQGALDVPSAASNDRAAGGPRGGREWTSRRASAPSTRRPSG